MNIDFYPISARIYTDFTRQRLVLRAENGDLLTIYTEKGFLLKILTEDMRSKYKSEKHDIISILNKIKESIDYTIEKIENDIDEE